MADTIFVDPGSTDASYALYNGACYSRGETSSEPPSVELGEDGYPDCNCDCASVVFVAMPETALSATLTLVGNVPAGTYRVDYMEGAFTYSNAIPNKWLVQGDGGVYVLFSDGTSDVGLLPGIADGRYVSQADAEAANAGQTGTLTWGGGNLYIYISDTEYDDNTDGSPNPTWNLTCIAP